MSRLGNEPVKILDPVKVVVNAGRVVVEGPKGKLFQELPDDSIEVKVEGDRVLVSARNKSRQTRAFHGLVRSLIKNMVVGVTEGYEKRLELVGTGYRVKKEGSGIEMSLGYSHPIKLDAPEGIEFEVEGNTIVIVKGFDKQLVGQMAANVRAARPPEPYKGKGVKYEDEVIRRKPGKAAKAAE